MTLDHPTLPPLHNSPTIPEALDFHAEHNAVHPIYAFSQNGEINATQITFLEFARASHRIAHALRPDRKGPAGQVVGVIMLVDTILYQTTTAGLLRAGLIPFPMSPRLTPAAVVHLMKKTSCHRIITTSETLQGLISGVQKEFSTENPQFALLINNIPSIQQVYPKLGAEVANDPFTPYPASENPPSLTNTAVYIHSSGSTGLPKAIPITHQMYLEWMSFGMLELAAHRPKIRLGAMASPPFHTLGFITQLLRPIYGAICVCLFPPTVFSPTDHPVVPTSDNTLEALRRTGSNALTIVPAILQAWAHDDEAIKFLKEFIFIGFSGGPMAERIGNELAMAGVNIKTLYGGTEFGPVTRPTLERGYEKYWDYMDFSPKASIRWVYDGDGKYECQFLKSENHHPAVENMDDPRGFATSDLFEKHPTEANLWKIVGRKDDVIIHSSGEKTVPRPIEEMISSSILVKDAIMFGREHDQVGVLIELAPNHTFDATNEGHLAASRNELWPIIEEANRHSPAFSRIFKEMILIVKPEKPLPRSPKGTIMRKGALAAYEDEVEALYKTIELTTRGVNVVPPENWSQKTIRQWIIAQACEVLSGRNVLPSKDLFEQGFDSLSATFLRLRITGALHSSKARNEAAEAISQNIVYQYPTIDALTSFVVGIFANTHSSDKFNEGHRAIDDMVAKYSYALDATVNNQTTKSDGDAVVVLTGSTGNLGSQILADLLRNAAVSKIYALNRPTSGTQSIFTRHKIRFKDKGLDTSLLGSEKLCFVECNLSVDRLGLEEPIYDQLRDSVTLIIHCAWRLDFNLTVPSFEGNVRGTYNLVNLARTSPHRSTLRFVFTSSIAVAQSWDKNKGLYPEAVISDAKYAVGGGYGEGKYIAERLLATSGIHSCSIRIGQISGGLPNGAWATSDWVPIMIKSGIALGALPESLGVVSWIPMDSVSRAILELAFTKESLPIAVNLVHPKPVPWKHIMQSVTECLVRGKKSMNELPLIPFEEWVGLLEERAESARNEDINMTPAIKLLDFFRKIAKANAMAKAEPVHNTSSGFNTSRAEEISNTMREITSIDAEDVRRWVLYWNGVGFFN